MTGGFILKKSISMLLAIVLILGMLPVTAFAADLPMVSLVVDKTAVKEGETVTLTMVLDGDVDGQVAGWQWNFIWDSTYFEATSTSVGNAAQPLVEGVESLAVTPIVNITRLTEIVSPYVYASVTQGNSYTPHYLKAGTIASVTLTAKQDIPDDVQTKFYIDYVLVMDSTGTPLDVVTTDPAYEWGDDYQTVPADTVGYSIVINESVSVTGITLDKTSVSLIEGENGTLSASVSPDDATDKTVTWTSSNESVATVADGVVTAVAAGTATITAKAGDQEATCAVTVVSADAAYTVTMGEDKSVVAGETLTIPVTVGHTTDVTTYNAFDMSFSYDASILELTSTEIEGLTVTTGEGTVRVQGYGADRAVGTAPFSLTFKAVGAGTTEVLVTSAKVDISANAISKDAPEAVALDAITTVTVSGYSVTLPDNFTGDSVAAPNTDYTFSEPEDYYDYDVTVTVGGEEVEVTDNGDGSYTIPADKVTGEIVVTATKEGKTFNVTLGTDLTGNATAQYMTDYIATLTAEEGYTYDVSVTIGGNTYTGYTVSEGVYTIPGADITGEIVFTVTKTEIPKNTFTVTFEGSAAGSVVNAAAEVEAGANYVFGVRRTAGYDNVVTATMGGEPVDVVIAGTNGDALMYRIDNVSGNLVITVEKTADLTVEVSQYVELDGKTVFLVTAVGTLEEGKAYAYDGNAMFYSEVYEAWCYLVIVEEGNTFTADDAKAKIAATETSYTTLTAIFDVNMSGLVDINDAQLVYDIYNAKYEDFSVVVMQKFLNADVNGDKVVNVTDAAAVVAVIQ